MQFHLPEVFQATDHQLYREKEVFLAHYFKLEKQRFLYALLMEFQSQPELTDVVLITTNDGKDLDADLTFAESFDVDDMMNYWETQAVQNSIRAAYVAELDKFCDGRTILRSQLLDDCGKPRFACIDELLSSIEAA